MSIVRTGMSLLCALGLATTVSAADALNVRLRILEQPSGPKIEATVYGHFVEHLGRGVYDGLWVGPESPIPNLKGWRRDAIEALRRIRVPVIRWPGGCFADDYDWRDGIGPPAARPQRLNKVWGGVIESNRVGTHEFMDLVELLGTEAYIAGNMGSMTPRAMGQWLEYMTSASSFSLAAERRRNGRDAPWRIKYFGVGNESWGCGGHMRPEFQADLHRQFATFLHAPVVRVASGDGEGRDEVTDIMMARAGKHMDAITLHYYTVPHRWDDKGRATGFDAARWAKTLEAARGIEARIVATTRIMDRHDPERRVALYVDEWGMWHDPEPGSNPAFLEQQNTLRDAMVAALSFHAFHRHTERVKMANIAQLANVLQALILTEGPRMLLTPTYHAFDLYLPFQGATPLQIELDTPAYREAGITLPAVDASAARDADGRLWVALVNLDPRQSARVSGLPGRRAQGRVLSAEAMDAHNRFDAPQQLRPQPVQARATERGLSLDLPPKSITVVQLESP